MQYILTQEEKNNLAPKEEVENRDAALESARILILAQSGWLRRCGHGYCDGCPVDSIGHHDWSGYKPIPHIADHKVGKLICRKTRHYSK